MMRRGLSKISMMRRGFTTSMFASESDLLRELRGTEEGGRTIELNDVLDVLRRSYNWEPQVFTNGEFRNNKDENQASGLLLAWAAKNKLSTAQVLRCYGKFARELDPDAEDHQNIRQVIKHEMKPGSILFSEPLTKRNIERLDISKDPRMSDVVIHCGTVYLSGQVPMDFESDFATQVTQTLEKVDSLLEKSGSSRSQILSAQLWIRDMDDFAEMNEIWNDWIDPENKPVRACVEAPMAHPNIRFEAMITAATDV